MPTSIRIKTTISVPPEWIPKIEEFKKKNGFQDNAELFRYLIRKVIIEGG